MGRLGTAGGGPPTFLAATGAPVATDGARFANCCERFGAPPPEFFLGGTPCETDPNLGCPANLALPPVSAAGRETTAWRAGLSPPEALCERAAE